MHSKSRRSEKYMHTCSVSSLLIQCRLPAQGNQPPTIMIVFPISIIIIRSSLTPVFTDLSPRRFQILSSLQHYHTYIFSSSFVCVCVCTCVHVHLYWYVCVQVYIAMMTHIEDRGHHLKCEYHYFKIPSAVFKIKTILWFKCS